MVMLRLERYFYIRLLFFELVNFCNKNKNKSDFSGFYNKYPLLTPLNS